MHNTNIPSGQPPQPNPGPPQPASVPQHEADALKAAWQQDATDLGLVVYTPATGEIHVGSFDAHGGHDLFLQNLGVTRRADWRGGIVSSGGIAINNSGLNVGRGHGQGMPPDEWRQVLQALQRAGLVS